MASTSRKGKPRAGWGSPQFVDPAAYEFDRVAIDSLLAHREYRIVPALLAMPTLGAETSVRGKAGSIESPVIRGARRHPIAAIARRLKKSPRLVSRQFREITGIGLRDVLMGLAMKRVAIALRESGLKIEAIAHDEGYTTGSALGRCFTEFVGMTPAEYRNGPSLPKRAWSSSSSARDGAPPSAGYGGLFGRTTDRIG